MNKICYINQPAGLGDILFCIKLAQKIKEKYNCSKIVWPVHPEYEYIKDYIVSENILFTTDFNQFPCRDYKIVNNNFFTYVPLCTSDSFFDYKKLKDKNYPSYAHGYIKYLFADICDWSDWDSYFEIKRNFLREENLFKKLGLKNNEYIFINKNFGTPPNFLSYQNINPQSHFKNVEMFISKENNIFDWLKIIENAYEIHTIETSICYIIEKIKCNNKKLIYSRLKYNNPSFEDDFIYVKNRTKLNWIYVK